MYDIRLYGGPSQSKLDIMSIRPHNIIINIHPEWYHDTILSPLHKYLITNNEISLIIVNPEKVTDLFVVVVERALCLVNEVTRLLSTAKNEEDVIEYFIARKDNFVIVSISFTSVKEQLYNHLIDVIHNYSFLLLGRRKVDRTLLILLFMAPRLAHQKMYS